MDILKTIKSGHYRRGRRILTRLHHGLTSEYRSFLKSMESAGQEADHIASLAAILPEFCRWRLEAGNMLAAFETAHIAAVHERITAMNREILKHLTAASTIGNGARWRLMQAMQHTALAEGDFVQLEREVTPPAAEGQPAQVILPTDMLYQCRQSLFPAERMMVVAGRRRNNRIILGAAFDVTGDASAGHVRANPQKLAQALIAMSSTSSHLAGWFHSHPGVGTESTLPSETDRRQHADWLKDYSPDLLSGIFVRDGTLRLWGTSLERGMIRPILAGSGVTRENGESHVYRIDPG